MCWAEHRGNYRNSLTHALDDPPYVDLKVVLFIEAIQKVVLIIDAIRIVTIISLSKKVSIVCEWHPREYYGAKEQ